MRSKSVIRMSSNPESRIDVVVAKRNVIVSSSRGVKHPESGINRSVAKSTLKSILIEFHFVATLWVGACHGVPRAFWLWDLQH